jgi:hypothetical protein
LTSWGRVRWTEAGQILALMDWTPAPGERPQAEPGAFFAELRAAGRRSEAVKFLGHALPRLEVVAWSARAVRDLGEGREIKDADARALRSALLWIQDPSEGRRRAAYDAAKAADRSGPERLAAMAAFFSGGSVAPDTVAPILPGRTVSGRFAAGAVLIAAGRTPDRKAALDRALDLGDGLATAGLKQAQ